MAGYSQIWRDTSRYRKRIVQTRAPYRPCFATWPMAGTPTAKRSWPSAKKFANLTKEFCTKNFTCVARKKISRIEFYKRIHSRCCHSSNRWVASAHEHHAPFRVEYLFLHWHMHNMSMCMHMCCTCARAGSSQAPSGAALPSSFIMRAISRRRRSRCWLVRHS